jgi:hypothetical protein
MFSTKDCELQNLPQDFVERAGPLLSCSGKPGIEQFEKGSNPPGGQTPGGTTRRSANRHAGGVISYENTAGSNVGTFYTVRLSLKLLRIRINVMEG